MHVLLLLIAVTVSLWLYRFYRNLKKYPPGPIPIPFIGNVFQIDQNSPHHTILNWSKKYGTVFTMWIGNEPNVMINDYENLKDFVVKKGNVFDGRPFNYAFQIYSNDKGIIFSQGQYWKEQRRFALHQLRDFGFGTAVMEDKIQEQIDSLKLHIQDIFDEQGAKNEAILNPTFPLKVAIGNIILSVVLGLKYQRNDPILQKLMHTIDENQNLFMQPLTQLLSVYPALGNIPLFSYFNKEKLINNSKILHDWAASRIMEHKEMFNIDEQPTDFTQAFLKESVRQKMEGGDVGTFTENQLSSTILDLYLAGSDTTVTTLRWAILFLLHNQKVQARVQEEIKSVVGVNKVSMHHRSQMQYTVAVLNEVQRLANILPINLQHETTADITINGYAIPKGTTVVPQMSSVHIDPDMFTDPLVFNPDRFINSKHPTKDKAETVMPFSMGKRQCLGESLARMELFLIFTSLLQNYSFKPINPAKLPQIQGHFQVIMIPQEYKCLIVKNLD